MRFQIETTLNGRETPPVEIEVLEPFELAERLTDELKDEWGNTLPVGAELHMTRVT